LVNDVIAGLRDPIDPDFVRRFEIDTSSPAVDFGTVERLVAEAEKVPARVWREVFADLLAYDDQSELPGIDVPTLLIWGDSDRLVGRSAQDRLLAALPRAELTIYLGVGHTPHLEEPTRFAEDVTHFVQHLEPLPVP
jgi:pimeloyl-ACP methyl ester carboxylesterase